MKTVDSEYFANINHAVNQADYNAYDTNFEECETYMIEEAALHPLINEKLYSEGFVIVKTREPTNQDPLYVSFILEKIFGAPLLDSNPGNLQYAKVQALDKARYYVASNLAQPIHTDQGHTVQFPQYAALRCAKSAQSGGLSIVVPFQSLYIHLISRFGVSVDKLFQKDCIEVENAIGLERKPILLRLDSHGRVGISYSSVLQALRCTEEVFEMYDYITSYVHNRSNQLRFRLDEGHILLIDNCRVLHGRTAFAHNDGRLLYRYWFGEKVVC